MKRAIVVALVLAGCAGPDAAPAPEAAPMPVADPTISYQLVGTTLRCEGAVSEFHGPALTYIDPYDHKTVITVDVATEGCYWRCADGTVVLVEANITRTPAEIVQFHHCG